MRNAQLKKIRFIQVVTLFAVVLLPLLMIFSIPSQAAYTNISLSQAKHSLVKKTSFHSAVTVTAEALHVRKTGDLSGKIIGMVHQGDTFKTLQSKNGWDQIKLSNNQTGWVDSAYITKDVSNENIKATVEAIVLNVREHPGLSNQIVGQLKFGTQITVHKEQKGWAKIVSPSGVQGWVDEYYITKETPNDRQTHPADITTSNTTNKKSVLTQNSQKPLKGETIVLDPGHGGIDDGTTSIVGTHEKTLTLATAKDVEQRLENAGANVIMTRTSDTYIPLQKRADLSNQNHADAFISFHYNWSNDPSAHGLVDFYYTKSKDQLLATDILNEVVQTTGLQSDGTRFDNLYVLRNNSQPCTLIELGFLSNRQDDSIVESSAYRDHVAQGVYQGLLDYFSGQK